MDDGNAELSDKLSDNVLFSNPESSSKFHASTSVNTDTVNELSCTHTHTCNPPGPDSTHTHTCYHTHTTQVFTSEEDTNSKPKTASGNREAVRKYREKKKAHTAYLEEEVKKLCLVNQQLMRKLQGQALLEAELSRLRNTLATLKGKIDSELGSFPFQNKCSSSTFVKRDVVFPCFHQHGVSSSRVNVCACGKSMMMPWEGNCQPEIVDCQVDTNNMTCTEGQTRDTMDKFMPSASQDG